MVRSLLSCPAETVKNPAATSAVGKIVMTNHSSEDSNTSEALIAVVRLRYQAFLKRFGRDPRPDEPLLFDPKQDEPTAASADERFLQIKDAADAANVDGILLLNCLGYLSSQYAS
jgi:hypothetical protein